MQTMSNFLIAACAGLAAMFTSSVQVLADPNVSVPVFVSASVASKTFTLGEPIVVHYSIHNTGAFSVHPDLSDGRHQYMEDGHVKWFSLSLKDSSGKQVPLVQDTPAPYQGAFASGPSILPGGIYKGNIIVNEWLNVAHSGKYVLSVTFNPYFPADGEHYLPQTDAPDTYTVPITVTDVDLTHLRATAHSLRAEIMRCHDDDQKQSLLDALFCLPEAEAGKEWQTLFFDKATSDRLRLMALENVTRLHTPSAVNFLAQVCWGMGKGGRRREDTDSAKAKAIAIASLDDMYAHSDIALKKYIESVFAANGQEPPSAPLVVLD